jgi:DNA-binding MarR family transcriptional regulator
MSANLNESSPVSINSPSKLDTDTRIAISKVSRVLDIFRNLDKLMPLSEVIVFLALAEEKEWVTLQNLSDSVGACPSACSRIVQALGMFDRNAEPGLDLIWDSVDIHNRRAKVRQLSPKGRRVIDQLTQIIKN